jgi:hypothetical protein
MDVGQQLKRGITLAAAAGSASWYADLLADVRRKHPTAGRALWREVSACRQPRDAHRTGAGDFRSCRSPVGAALCGRAATPRAPRLLQMRRHSSW